MGFEKGGEAYKRRTEDEKRTREIEGKEESMEGKKPPPSTSEELVHRKDASSSSPPPPPPPGYFSSIFPPASTVMSKGAPPTSDLYRTLNKNCRAGAQTVNYPSGDADGRSQGTNDGDVKLLHPIESSTESSCFGSSVHYGGRDFYVSPSPSIDPSEASCILPMPPAHASCEHHESCSVLCLF